jgi:hypothetical protein
MILGPGLITEKNELLGLKIKPRRDPRLARKHPNGESEGILDGPTPMVRPELRRGYDGHPRDIDSSGESRGGSPRGDVSVTGSPQS